MHTNHRRRAPRPKPKADGKKLVKWRSYWTSIENAWGVNPMDILYSKRWMKRQKSKDRRSDERRRMHHGDYDALPTRYPNSIIWEYW